MSKTDKEMREAFEAYIVSCGHDLITVEATWRAAYQLQQKRVEELEGLLGEVIKELRDIDEHRPIENNSNIMIAEQRHWNCIAMANKLITKLTKDKS